MTLSPSLAVCFATIMLITVSMNYAQERQSPHLYVSRTLGFRPASFMTPQSDYTFEVDADGTWKYRSFATVDGKPYQSSGKLPYALEAFDEKLQELGINDIPEPDPNAPQVADLPEVGIRRQVDEQPWVRKIKPDSEPASGLHDLIQTIVMGVREIPADPFPLVDDQATGVTDPLVIESESGLFQVLGEKDATRELSKSIDFDNDVMLVFRWAGSGRDLFYVYRDLDDENLLTFGYQAGMTRDLRQHARYYVVDKDLQRKVVKVAPRRR